MSSRIPVPASAYRAAYRLQQAALRAPVLGAHQILRRLTANEMRASPPAMTAVREQYDRLLERDLANVRDGLYPKELLFQMPLGRYARGLPQLMREVPRTIRRARRRNYRDLPRDVNLDDYPAYYRRNFHWQTDGYLSRSSAELYDLSVEFLFLGVADVMRRQVIPPVTRHLRDVDGPARILDVACGTGATMRQMATALPDNKYYGLDLSPYYVQVARDRLASVPEAFLVAENAEHMPYRASYFDAIVSVYLFHELPHDARRNVLSEMYRVLKPGGRLVIEDSAQMSEAAELAYFLDNFSAEMHEPYYRSYVRDDLAGALEECGFVVDGVERCFVAKVVAARKPESAATT